MEPIPFPRTRTLTVLLAPGAGGELVTQFLAELALHGPLTVLDGGNRFAAYRLMQHLRLHSPDPDSAARRIIVRRAFTCYQMLALLGDTPSLPQPYVLLDPLATFYDEQVPLPEVTRLLEGCLLQVERLRHCAPVLAALCPPSVAERTCLAERVCAAADNFYTAEAPFPQVLQPALF